MPRIVYYGGNGNRRPSGGLQTLLQHVRWLRQDGFDSFLQTSPSFDAGFYDMSGIDQISTAATLADDDYVVYPEPDLRPLNLASNYKKWVFCQNHYYIYNTVSEAGGWEESGVDGILTSSMTILDHVRQHYPGLPAEFVPYSIDRATFRSAQPKLLQIAYMPRKRPIDAKYIRGTFGRRFPELTGVEWLEIDGRESQDVGVMLGKAGIFLALGRIEGFGLPPVEAMASGALVVGFSGGGTDDYAREHTGLWAKPDDFDAVVNNLALAVVMVRDDFKAVHTYRRAGFRVAGFYSEDRARTALRTVWSRILKG